MTRSFSSSQLCSQGVGVQSLLVPHMGEKRGGWIGNGQSHDRIVHLSYKTLTVSLWSTDGLEPSLEAHWGLTQKGKQQLNVPLQRKRGPQPEKGFCVRHCSVSKGSQSSNLACSGQLFHQKHIDPHCNVHLHWGAAFASREIHSSLIYWSITLEIQLEQCLLIYCSSINENRSSSDWSLISLLKGKVWMFENYKYFGGKSRADYLAHDRYMTYFWIMHKK